MSLRRASPVASLPSLRSLAAHCVRACPEDYVTLQKGARGERHQLVPMRARDQWLGAGGGRKELKPLDANQIHSVGKSKLERLESTVLPLHSFSHASLTSGVNPASYRFQPSVFPDLWPFE